MKPAAGVAGEARAALEGSLRLASLVEAAAAADAAAAAVEAAAAAAMAAATAVAVGRGRMVQDVKI